MLWGASEDIAGAARCNSILDALEHWEEDFENWAKNHPYINFYGPIKAIAKKAWEASLIHALEKAGGKFDPQKREVRYM